MKNWSRFVLSAALVAGMSFVSFGARIDAKPDGAVDLTTSSSGSVVADSNPYNGTNYRGVRAFDDAADNSDTRWLAYMKGQGGKTDDLYIVWKFNEPTAIDAYMIRNGGSGGANQDTRSLKAWTLWGSTDNESWTLLDTESESTKWSSAEQRYFKTDVQAHVAYSYYKFLITENFGNSLVQIHEIELYAAFPLVPRFEDCSLVSAHDGEYTLSGIITENAPTALSLVLTPEGEGDEKTVSLNVPTLNEPFEETISAEDEGIPTTVLYMAKLVAENENGTSEKALGCCYFGPLPRPTAYARKIEFTVSDGIKTTLGDGTMTDFPVLVRLSSESVADYDPSAFVCEGRDLYFEDENGSALSFELDTFDPAGETLVWVKIPSLSASTKFTCYYGGPENILNDPKDVWTGYLGVWHFNTTDTMVPNATANANLDASASAAATELAGEATPFGSPAVQGGAAYEVADYEPAYNVGNKFSVSGWFKMPSYEGGSQKYATWITKKTGLSWNATTGWYLQMNQSKTKCGLVESSSTETIYSGLPDVSQNWIYFHYVNDGASEKVYFNGSTTPGISRSGGTINKSSVVFRMLAANQQGDEFRLTKSTWSALRTSLEYKSMKKADFLSNSGSSAMDASAPVFETPIVQVASDGSAAITFTVTDGEGDVYTLVDGVKTLVGAIGTDITLNEPKTVAIAIDADACVSVGVYGVNSKGTEVTRYAESGVMNAAVEAVVTNDANERGLVPGVFTLSRPDGISTDQPIVVNLTWEGGTAIQGKNYTGELPASVTIPAGGVSTTVTVTPLRDSESENDETIILTVAAGAYKSGATATMKILNLVTDPNYNTWIAAADGKASDAANWSQGVPQAGQKILFDPQFSNANCEWDGGVNGLSSSVAEWTQADGFTGTITFDTTYTGAFTSLAVAGDVTLNGGTWTHQRGAVNNSTPTYRLKVTAGGAFTLGTAAKVNLKGKGLAGGQKPTGSSAGSHASSCDGYSKIYGNVYAPDMPGSGANGANNWGGGAFWLEAAGAATIDGTITVRTDEADNIKQPAAGSVYIKAASCSGAGNIYADYSATASYEGGAGSGGRVAIILTEANELAFPEGNVAIKGRLSGGTHGGGGTFFYKTANQANGTLVLDDVREKNYAVRWHRPTQITAIPAGETWTFDAIKIKRYGMLAIPEGTTLNLPNGPQSVTASSTRQGGLLYQGGTINWGTAPYVFAGNWIFQPNVPYTFDGDVTIADKGAIGCMIYQGEKDFSDMAKCEFTVNGTLTIDKGGAIYAKGGGPDQGVSRNSYAAHGGATMNSDCLQSVYDSIFNPSYPGYTAADGDQATTRSGGGLVKVTVNGDLVVNGTVNAEGWLNGDIGAAGSGGTINITANTLSGEGSMTVDATRESRWTYYNVGGAGRIAVRLTDGVFSDYWRSHITAKGRSWYDSSKSVEHGASAGTVYLQEKGVAEKASEIIIGNDGVDDEYKAYTYLPVTSTRTPTDALDDFKNAGLTLSGKALVKLSSTFKARQLDIGSGSVLDLNGQTLTVSTAKFGDAKVKAGTYTASDYPDFLTGEGSLVVKGGGLVFIIQ